MNSSRAWLTPLRALIETVVVERLHMLTEGGAAGHMAHPFDVESVQTGMDLVQLFFEAAVHLQKNPAQASVKIDGINTSIRLATVDGTKQFVIDRGSNKPLDVRGVTKTDLESRFGVGHGMIERGGKVLDIFNSALPAIKPELVQLGMFDNPNIMFNMEYVAGGKTNVQEYQDNFLAIHGLLEVMQATPTKRTTTELSFNKSVLERLIEKLQPYANKHGFKVLHAVVPVPSKLPGFKEELHTTYSVNLTEDQKESKSLMAWLSSVKSLPRNTTLKLANGKKVEAISKEVFMNIMNGTPLSTYLAEPSPQNIKAAIDGFVVYLATMKLGEALLDSLESDLGPVSSQEGVVVRGLTPKPFKITGSFIIRGLESAFAKG